MGTGKSSEDFGVCVPLLAVINHEITGKISASSPHLGVLQHGGVPEFYVQVWFGFFSTFEGDYRVMVGVNLKRNSCSWLTPGMDAFAD